MKTIQSLFKQSHATILTQDYIEFGHAVSLVVLYFDWYGASDWSSEIETIDQETYLSKYSCSGRIDFLDLYLYL